MALVIVARALAAVLLLAALVAAGKQADPKGVTAWQRNH